MLAINITPENTRGAPRGKGLTAPTSVYYLHKYKERIPDWRMQSAIGQYVIENLILINHVVLGSLKKSISLFRMQR